MVQVNIILPCLTYCVVLDDVMSSYILGHQCLVSRLVSVKEDLKQVDPFVKNDDLVLK